MSGTWVGWRWATVLGVLLTAHVAAAQEQTETPSAPNLEKLAGNKVSLVLQGRRRLDDVDVVKVVPGDQAGAVRSLTVRESKGKTTTVAGATVVEIYLAGEPLDVAYDKQTRQLAHSPDKRQERMAHEAEVRERLKSQRQHLWPELTEDEQQQWLQKHKAYIEEVQQALPNVRLELVETKYYLFLTDIPPARVGVFVGYLDTMYDELCQAFGLPVDKNIWCGKCVVVAFQEQSTFQLFEDRLLHKPNDTTQGHCHHWFDAKLNTTMKGWQYGVAASLVELLLKIDASKYRQLLDQIKEGIDPETALQNSYGMNYQQLSQRYGQAIGVPRVTP